MGDHPPGAIDSPTPATGIVQAPGANAVLVSNAKDKAVYFYKEGMAAPMGNFNNYGRQPRAVTVVNRTLQERSSPGIYETVARLRRPGRYDVVFFLDAPRMVECFDVTVAAKSELERQRQVGRVNITPMIKTPRVRVGDRVSVAFKITDLLTQAPRIGLQDVQVLTYLAPGTWHQRHWAKPAGNGVYAIEFVPQQAGTYYVHMASQSLGLDLNHPQYVILHAAPAGDKSKSTTGSGQREDR